MAQNIYASDARVQEGLAFGQMIEGLYGVRDGITVADRSAGTVMREIARTNPEHLSAHVLTLARKQIAAARAIADSLEAAVNRVAPSLPADSDFRSSEAA